MKQLIKKIRINTTLTVLTGLHIGGSSDNVEIGGLDNPVIKIATRENQPYIPGSSLKGKMRCLLEQVNGAAEVGDNEKVNNLFGFAKKNMPSKHIHFHTGLSSMHLLLTSHVFPTQVKTHHQSRVVNDGTYVLHTLKKCQDFGSGF